MFALADWHGRVVDGSLRIPGELPAARAVLAQALDRFDRKRAERPPFKPPAWAAALLALDGGEAMAAFLESAHGGKGAAAKRPGTFQDLAGIYRSLDVERDLMAFARNYLEACRKLAPEGVASRPGQEAEGDLLQEITFCRNDKVKFEALETCGRCLPLDRAAFFAARAKRAWEGARNGNVVLISCLGGLQAMAARVAGGAPPGLARLLAAELAFPARVLQTEERNNSACQLAARAIEAILDATGAPEALEAYINCLRPPRSEATFIIAMTERFRVQAAEKLASWTGQRLGTEEAAWRGWYAKNRASLVYDRARGRFAVRR